MRVALLHDYLNQLGGGERVLEVLMEMFPSAPIYTLIYDADKTRNKFAGREIHTSFLNSSFVSRHHRLFIPFMPLAAKALRIPDEFDLVISDTAGFAKGFSIGSNTKHLSYIYTPLRYAWETNSYFQNRIFTALAKPLFSYVRNFDYQSAQKPDKIITLSNFIADKIKKYFGRDSEIVYPPYDESKFFFNPKPHTLNPKPYFLAVGRLLPYKKFDLIIDAFNKLNLPLKIAGEGREFNNLKKLITSKLITFTGFAGEKELRELYAGARALIFPQVEDFGLVAVEANACGTPVIAYNAGGIKEIVIEGKNGIFFNEQTPESLIAAIKKFETMKFDRAAVATTAARFFRANFENHIRAVIKNL